MTLAATMPTPAVRERTLRIRGLRVFVREVGEGQPVLLVNGIGAHTGMWAPLEQGLQGVRLIEFDAPGTGRSDTPNLPRTVPAMADLAAGVLDAVGLDQADVVGYSLGGIVSQELAARSPHRVRRLVLAATACGLGSVPGDLAARLNIATPFRYWSQRFNDRTLGSLVGGRARHDEQFIAHHGDVRRRYPPTAHGYVGQMLAVASWTTLPSLPRITAPTFVVMAGDDPLVPAANGRMLIERIPDARLLLAPSEGHLFLMDPDSNVLEPIRQFLTATELDSAPAWRDAVRPDRGRPAFRTPAARALEALGTAFRRFAPHPAGPGQPLS